MATKGLNTTDSKNRIRFETISERLQKINVDIVHKTDVSGSLNLVTSKTPETGSLGCYFQDELELYKTLDISSDFKRFYYDIWPYVQSLPELLHHQNIIITKLIEKINTISPLNFDTFLKLISVLGRDLQDDLYPHFHELFISLVNRVDDIAFSLNAKHDGSCGLPNPEMTGKLFECLSYLTKFMLLKLTDDPDSMRQYYGTLLGHSTSFVREYSAKCFTILLRKLKSTKFKNHAKKLMKALAMNCKNVCIDSKDSKDIQLDEIFRVREIENSDDQSKAPRRIKDILDGVALLFFGTLKGIKNNMHSQGSKKFTILLELLLPLDKSLIDEYINMNGKKTISISNLPEDIKAKIGSFTDLSKCYAFMSGEIICSITLSLFRHVEPKNMVDLWTNLLSAADSLSSSWMLFSILSDCPENFSIHLEFATQYIVECLIFAVRHSNGRGLGEEVRKSLSKDIIQKCFDLCEICHKLDNRIAGNVIVRLRILFCRVWNQFSSHTRLNKLVGPALNLIVVSVYPKPAVLTIAKELLTSLPEVVVRSQLIGPILKAAVSVDGIDETSWLSLVTQIIIKLKDIRQNDEMMIDDNYEFLVPFTKDLSNISEKCFHILNNFSNKDAYDKDQSTQKNHIQAINILRWLTITCPDALKSKSMKENLSKLRKTITGTIKDAKELLKWSKIWGSVLLAHSLSFICASIESVDEYNDLEFILKLIGNFVEVLKQSPKSISLMWGFLQLLNCLDKVDLGTKAEQYQEMGLVSILNANKCDQILELLSEILTTPCYWLRFGALKVLQYFPKVKLLQKQVGDDTNDQFVELAKICLDAATTPLTLESEREFSRLLGMLEVLVREGRLPTLYEKIVCSICFGMLNVKFKPVWEPCILVLVAACNRQDGEIATWPFLLNSLEVLGLKSLQENIVEIYSAEMKSVEIILNIDDGNDFINSEVALSEMFYFVYHDNCLVNPDSRTDYETVYGLLWDIFKRCPSITLKRSKTVIPIFLRFLKSQYYKAFGDDPEVPYLHNIGLFSVKDIVDDATKDFGTLKPKILKKRLEMFLGVFAAVTSPKQLYMHQLLYAFYCSLLAKPDLNIVKLGFDCILTYKPEYVIPYKDRVKNLLDDKKLRNELITFTLSVDDTTIDKSHRIDIIPLVSSIVFGRFVSKARGSKAAREQSLSRRVAVLSFISHLQGDELRHFMHLMMRGIVPRESTMNEDPKGDHIELRSSLVNQYDVVEKIVMNISPGDITSIAWERQVGFLHVLEHVVKVIGFNAKNHIQHFIKLVKTFMANAETLKKQLISESEKDIKEEEEADVDEIPDNDDDNDDDNENEKSNINLKHNNLIIKIRTMCINRLAEMVHQYHDITNFSTYYENIFDPIQSLLTALPTSLLGTNKPSALLKLIHGLVKYNKTSDIVINNEFVLVTVIQCVASRTENAVTSIIMEILTEIMNINGGESIFKHAELIIQSFSKRFVGSDFEGHIFGLKFSDLKITASWSVKQELKILSNIAEAVFMRSDVKIDSMIIADLATLLLGMLRKYTTSKKVKVEEEWVVNILKIYKSLLSRMIDVKPHVTFVSRLFGPATHSLSLFNLASVRKVLVEVYMEMAAHESTNNLLSIGADAISRLVSMDPQILDARDFGECMPVFQALSASNTSNEYSWSKLLGPENSNSQRETSMCTVIIYECIRCMYDSELVLRAAALASLKRFAIDAGQWSGVLEDSTGKRKKAGDLSYLNFLTGILLPEVRRGLKVSSDTVKKGFVSLLAYVIANLGRTNELGSDPMFHGDLSILLHEDPEQDFFENIVHVQLHRRVKALARLRQKFLKLGNSSEDEIGDKMDIELNISIASLVHVLLPLGYHPLTSSEFTKKDHLSFLQEAATFVGAVCSQLPWNHYLFAIRTILKHLDRKQEEKEKVLLSALCSVLDSFHFDMSTDYEVDGVEIAGVIQADETNKIVEDNKDKVVDEENDENEIVEIINDEEGKVSRGANIVRLVINSIIPWVRVFLLKEEKDHSGNKSQTVRTQVAVALTKLINRLQPPTVTNDKKKALFLTLVISVVNTLKSRDTSARDAARESLQKMVNTMGLESLQWVIHELLFNLTEGYQRHVCNYTIRNLITSVTTDYSPPLDAESVPVTSGDIETTVNSIEIIKPVFDSSIPLLVKCVLDEICGQTHEDRTVDEAKRTVIREAKGSKAHDIVEATARCLLFRPTYALQSLDNPSSVSSIHALTTPLLSLLHGCENNEIIGRISETLQRIAIGLSRNPTVNSQELLLYLHATLNPFVTLIIKEHDNRKRALGRILTKRTDDDEAFENDEDIDGELPSYLREDSSDEETAALYSKKKKRRGDNVTGFKASTWLPAEQHLKNQRSIIEERNREIQERVKVQDGASAPKLTGTNRHKESASRSSSGQGDMDPAHIAAVRFCLFILNSALNKNKLDSTQADVRTMAMPFLHLLGQCLRMHGSANIVALAMRCICSLLTWNLPIDHHFARAIGSRMLKLMFKGGALLSTDNELVQACIKGLVSMFTMYNEAVSQAKALKAAAKTNKANSNEVNDMIKKVEMPLNENKLRYLVQLLTVSVMEVTSTYQNAAFQLVNAIVNTKILIPEIYDLVAKIMEQIVLSHRKGIREAASEVVLNFLLNYPLGEKRLANHMKQLIVNCSYEFEDGRKSALETLMNLTKAIPVALLEENIQLIFMPMAMKLVNDNSSVCREAAANVIISICRRVSVEFVTSLIGYATQWLSSDISSMTVDPQKRAIVRTGAQVAGIICSARPDVFKRNQTVSKTISLSMTALYHMIEAADFVNNRIKRRGVDMAKHSEGEGEGGGLEAWAVIYYLLCYLEQVFTHLPAAADNAFTHVMPNVISPSNPVLAELPLMGLILETLLFPHSWVRSVACRVLKLYMSRRDVTLGRLSTSNDGTEILIQPNALYNLARKLCVVLNQPELPASLLEATKYSVVFTIRAMENNPDLSKGSIDKQNDEGDLEDDEDDGNNDVKNSFEDTIDDEADNDNDNDNDNDDNDNDNDDDDNMNDNDEADDNKNVTEVEETNGTGSNWIIQRLRGLGADIRGKRRLHVIKIFSSLVSIESEEYVQKYVTSIIEVAIRAQMIMSGPDMELIETCKEASTELLNLIENKIGSSSYLGAYSDVQRRLQTNKSLKRSRKQSEAITDPKSFANKKLQNTLRKKNGKKKNTLKYLAIKGFKKQKGERQHNDDV